MAKITVEYDEVKAETSLAWLVDFGDVEHWLPKSQCDIDRETSTIAIEEFIYNERFPDG